MIRRVFHDPMGNRRGSSVEAYHEFLVEAKSLEEGGGRVFSFLESYQLLQYGRVEVAEDKSLAGPAPSFTSRLEEAAAENRRRLQAFIVELQAEGFDRLSRLAELEQGPCSNTFHTIAHLLDGFFGIDSFFYNLPEGSHGVSEGMKKKILASPEQYCLIAVRASI